MSKGFTLILDNQVDSEMLEEVTRVEVHERLGAMTTYRLRFKVDVMEGDLRWLTDERLGPGSELAVVAGVEEPAYLVRGPVYGQQIHLTHGVAGSWVDVDGADRCIEMDRESKVVTWSDVTDSDAAAAILAQYGFSPDVEKTDAGHYENKHVLMQRESDLQFLQKLARRNGFYLWITSDETADTAHFVPPPLSGEPDATLIINLDDANLEAMDLAWDVERPTSVVGQQLDLNSKSNLDGAVRDTPTTLLGNRGLGEVTSDPRSVHVAAPVDDTGDLQARGKGALTEAGWFIRATCRTSLNKLGRLVRAHTLVEVQGAGSRHSGRYLVAEVHHTLDVAAHTMDIVLFRNAWNG